MKLPDNVHLGRAFADGIPERPIDSVCEFGRRHVRLIGSALREQYDPELTPWTRTPLECTGDGFTRSVSFAKPVQSGGSSAGEIAVCRRLALKRAGDIQWNWESDEKAIERWDKRINRILRACGPVSELLTAINDRFKDKKCLVIFAHCNLIVQGQHTSDNLDSDSIAFQVNEELHNWKPGHLAKADARLTAVWNGFQFNISNASFFGDQFHQKFLAGTQEHWEVPCPECGKYHAMRARYDPKHPELGGIKYNADGCRLPNGEYDYNKLAGTIRYQFPCGHEIPDDKLIRKRISARGKYVARNEGARKTDRSFTLEAVSVDYIPWLKLIQEKHAALRALRHGDPEPWWKYLRERECVFANPDEDRPSMGAVILNARIRKNRDGLPNRAVRLAALDRQQGSLAKGELPHWWLVIRDFDKDGNSLLVHESKCLTDEDAVDRILGHDVKPTCVAVDSGDDTTHVYQFCLRHGFNAIKGSGEASFAHGNGARRIYSPERPLHMMINAPRTKSNAIDEPLFWHYSKSGLMERFFWVRGSELKWDVPCDVSEDYKSHLESWELSTRRHPRTNEEIFEYVQVRKRDDLLKCEQYVLMMAEMAGLIGAPSEKITRNP